MAGIGRQRRIEQPADLGLPLEPGGQFQRIALVPLQPHVEGPKPAVDEVAIVGTRGIAPARGGVLQPPVDGLAAGRHRSEHDIRMARQIFGRRGNRDVHVMLDRPEQQRGCPGIVERRNDAALARRPGDGAHVSHLERQRAWRLEEHHPRVRLEQVGDAAPDLGRKIGDFDAIAGEDLVAEPPGGAIGGVDHQQMIAGLHEGGEAERDGRRARRGDHGAMAPLQGGDGLGQSEGGLGAVEAVDDPVIEAVVAPDIVLDRVVEDGRRPVHRRIEETGLPCGGRARMSKPSPRGEIPAAAIAASPMLVVHRRSLPGRLPRSLSRKS